MSRGTMLAYVAHQINVAYIWTALIVDYMHIQFLYLFPNASVDNSFDAPVLCQPYVYVSAL